MNLRTNEFNANLELTNSINSHFVSSESHLMDAQPADRREVSIKPAKLAMGDVNDSSTWELV